MSSTPNTPPRTLAELFPSRWLSADDLKGKSYVLKIVAVTVERMNGIDGEHWAGVLTLEGAQKRLVLNKTQARTLEQITGTDELARWVGHTVQLIPGSAPNHKPTILIKPAPAPTMPKPTPPPP